MKDLRRTTCEIGVQADCLGLQRSEKDLAICRTAMTVCNAMWEVTNLAGDKRSGEGRVLKIQAEKIFLLSVMP